MLPDKIWQTPWNLNNYELIEKDIVPKRGKTTIASQHAWERKYVEVKSKRHMPYVLRELVI